MDLDPSTNIGCAVVNCHGEGVFACYGSQFCRLHVDKLESIRKELQLAKKRKKIYLEHHLRLHEAAVRGIDERHVCRLQQLEELIMKKQGSLAAAFCLFVCRLDSCDL